MFFAKRNVTPEPSTLVIFGGTGDLACRKLYPALYNLYRVKRLPPGTQVVGVGRREYDRQAFQDYVAGCIQEHSRKKPHALEVDFLRLFHYQALDLAKSDTFASLEAFLAKLTDSQQKQHIFYMAVPPEVFAPTVRKLAAAGLAKDSRVVLEKPFGWDLASARALQQELAAVFPESAIFRLDHYLGKEMLQNIMMIRMANTVFEPLWNKDHVASIQLQVNESVGIGQRGRYYEQAGALRDMVQNHLMQVLAFTAMEPPRDFSADALRDEKVRVIKALRPLTEETIATQVVRGQYGPGTIHGETVVGYRQEPYVSPDSQRETFVAMKLYIDNPRWQGVPFYLRTGKRLPQRSAQVVVEFKKNSNLSFLGDLAPNLLVIKIQPEEGVAFQFNVKEPDTEFNLRRVLMSFCQNCDYPENSPEAYERLLHDILVGDATLFTRWDEVEATWEYVQSILEAWERDTSEIPQYPAGTWGPEEAQQLLAQDGKVWWVDCEDRLRCFHDN